jgi:hypothetical protein
VKRKNWTDKLRQRCIQVKLEVAHCTVSGVASHLGRVPGRLPPPHVIHRPAARDLRHHFPSIGESRAARAASCAGPTYTTLTLTALRRPLLTVRPHSAPLALNAAPLVLRLAVPAPASQFYLPPHNDDCIGVLGLEHSACGEAVLASGVWCLVRPSDHQSMKALAM